MHETKYSSTRQDKCRHTSYKEQLCNGSWFLLWENLSSLSQIKQLFEQVTQAPSIGRHSLIPAIFLDVRKRVACNGALIFIINFTREGFEAISSQLMMMDPVKH